MKQPHLSLRTDEPTAFGHGFLSGLLSCLLGIAGLGTVICLRFPAIFTTAQLRPLVAFPYLRPSLHVILVAAFLLATASLLLRANKTMGLTGLGLTLAAALLGGSRVPLPGEVVGGTVLGLDFFVLSLILYSAVFVPLERAFPLHPEQPVFRREWLVDLTYFFFNTLLVEVLALFTLMPAFVLFDWARVHAVAAAVSSLPLPVQVLGLLLVADFAQYWIHRTFHAVPVLWPFHAIHHSSESMDWLAGSRLHLVDVIVTRGLSYVPIYVLGFSNAALYVYVFLVAIQATFIHANVRWEFRPLQRVLATPAFHHWHHAAEPEAADKNFAVHTPLWDLLFGTFYMPGRWPRVYGLIERRQVPSRWFTQLVYPFRRRPRP